MEAEVGGDSRWISSKGETTKREQRDLVGSPRAHGKASPNWSFHPEPLTNSLTLELELELALELN